MANETRYFKTPFAESGTRTEVPNTSVGGAVGFDTGFGSDYELPQGSAGRKRIERDKYNGLHHSITKNVKQWQEELYPTWIEDNGDGVAFAYPIGMIVSHDGQNWLSVEAANQEEPGAGVEWKVYAPVTSLQELSGLTDPSDLDRVYQKTVNNLTDVSTYNSGSIGAYIRVKNTYGVEHVRIISATNDGSGVLLASGNYANLVIIEPRTIYASQLGMVDNEDYTTLINTTLIQKLKDNKITDFILDSGDIVITSTLNEYYGGVNFYGSGRVLSTSRDNILQRMTPPNGQVKQFHGKINTGTVYNQISRSAIQYEKDIRIVILGDSIFNSADYDTNSIPIGERNTTGVDNVDRTSCVTSSIFNELVAALPADVRIRVFSRSIGGLDYSYLDRAWDSLGASTPPWDGREQVTAGKTWRDCVLDLNPDLVIHGIGMNGDGNAYFDNFVSKWAQYIDTKQKSRSFNQALITTPNPNFKDALQFGDFRGYGLNAKKFYTANLQRYVARRYKYSLIDVATNSYIKRYGFDPRSCVMKKDSTPFIFPNGASSKVIAAGADQAESSVLPNYMPFYFTTKFVINSSVASSSATYDFQYRCGDVILQFTNSSIIIYTGQYTNAGNFSESYSYVLPANVDVGFTMTILPTGVYLYKGDELIITYNVPVYKDTSYQRFINAASTGANVTIVSGFIRGQQFPRYSPDTLTNGELYGDLDYTLNEFGGGINHPSSVGIMEIYRPPITEFITDLVTANYFTSDIIGGTVANEAVYIGRAAAVNYNRIKMLERGSGRETIIDITVSGEVVTYTVIKNSGTGISVYFDPVDLSLFIKNTTAALLQVEYSGLWLSKEPIKLGVVTPRGTLLPTVA